MENLTVESYAKMMEAEYLCSVDPAQKLAEVVGLEMVGNMTSGDIVDSHNEYAERNHYERYYPISNFKELVNDPAEAIQTAKGELPAELFRFDGLAHVVFLDYSDAEEEASDDPYFLRWLATDGGNTVDGDAEEIYDFYSENKDAILAKAKEGK